jgi:hypothetical protein
MLLKESVIGAQPMVESGHLPASSPDHMGLYLCHIYTAHRCALPCSRAYTAAYCEFCVYLYLTACMDQP